ncbi:MULTISPECIES: hypothetical protein [unclassified Streptomyces]|nr:hypothetical protein [Streptomyces sp. NBC_00243]WRZ17938.1 hypothetical protein OHT59_05255 [Streptomyces sp. NBC_00243]WUC17302.1 hypothetical protein OG256_46255 [Streptomyces sp. NBC_00564]
MADLPDLVLAAHGCLDWRRQDKTIHATGAAGGPGCAPTHAP